MVDGLCEVASPLAYTKNLRALVECKKSLVIEKGGNEVENSFVLDDFQKVGSKLNFIRLIKDFWV